MIQVADLPSVNAALNATSAVLLTVGFVFIRKRNVRAHKTCMVSAFVASIAFLACYVVYHAHVGSKPFPHQGIIRPVYYTILVTHVVLAAAIVPLAVVTLARAARGRFEKHARIARVTLPIWLYVSVTGVAIYWMLYRL